MTDTMYCCVCRGNIADFYHAIHVHAMAYSLLLAYRHFSSLLSSVFLLSQNWFKKDLTIESLSKAKKLLPCCKAGKQRELLGNGIFVKEQFYASGQLPEEK